MSGDKVTRADAVASQCNVGRVGTLRAGWNAAVVDELGSFPLGVHLAAVFADPISDTLQMPHA
jgi:phage terminase large subunit-like protein